MNEDKITLENWSDAFDELRRAEVKVSYSRPSTPAQWPATQIDADGLTCPVCGYYGKPTASGYAASLLQALASALSDTMQAAGDSDPIKKELLDRVEKFLRR